MRERRRGQAASGVAAESSEELTLEFRGVAREYFRIWIVNLCLTLLTLGIFSAWAKVRKKRYFYSHTILDGTPFQYLAQPLPILKGRVIAAVAFSIYYASSHLFLIALPYVLAAALPLAPWVIVRSAAFNARYSAFRNMTLHFAGTYWDAAVLVFWGGLIPGIVVGQSYRWWGHEFLGALAYVCFGLTYPAWQRHQKKFLVAHTSYGNAKGELSLTSEELFGVYFAAGVLIVFAVFGGALMMGVASKAPKVVSFWLSFGVMYGASILISARVRAQVSNLVWNQTRLGPLRFRSTLRGGELGWIYLTNIVAVMLSLGLLIPWAVVRTLRYRAACLGVLASGDLGELRGSNETTVQAAGAELGEFFDLDFSL